MKIALVIRNTFYFKIYIELRTANISSKIMSSRFRNV